MCVMRSVKIWQMLRVLFFQNACCLWFLFCDLGWLEFWGILDFDLGEKCLVSREFEVSKFKTTVNEVWIFVDILICGQS